MQFNLSTIVKNLLPLSIGIILLVWLFYDKDLDKMFSLMVETNFYWILVSRIVVIFAHFTRALRWSLLLESLGYKPKASNTFYAVMIGYLANLAVPRIGEVARCWALRRTESIKIMPGIGTIIVERAIDLLSILILVGIVILIKLPLFNAFYTQKLINVNYFNIGSLGLIVLISLLIIIVLIFLVARKKIKKFLLPHWEGLYKGLSSIKHLPKKIQFLFYTLLMWVLYIFAFYLSFFSMEYTQNFTFSDILWVFAFSNIAWLIPIQGGIGAYHWIVANTLLILGIGMNDGLYFATLLHGSTTLIFILVGLVSLFIVMKGASKEIKK